MIQKNSKNNMRFLSLKINLKNNKDNKNMNK